MKIYFDTSVISAYFDFQKPVRQLITQKWFLNDSTEFELFASTLVLDELQQTANDTLRTHMLTLLDDSEFSILEMNDRIFEIAQTYRNSILIQEINDTIHIATASYYQMDAIVSWNFHHIVNLKTMKSIQSMNMKLGLPGIQILTLENLGGDQYGTL